MKFSNQILTFLIVSSLILQSCSKDIHSEHNLNLDKISEDFLPSEDMLSFVSPKGERINLNLIEQSNYYITEAIESYSSMTGTKYLYSDHENWKKKYSSSNIIISYHLFGVQSNAGSWNELNVSLQIKELGQNMNLHLTRSSRDKNTGWNETKLIYRFRIENLVFKNVHEFNQNGNSFYFQQGRGLVFFRIGEKYWYHF